MVWLTSLFGAIGTGIKSFFGFKQHQAETLQSALQVLGDVNVSNAQREQAIATIIAAEASSGYALAAIWRPLAMLVFLGIIVSAWFGYVPPHFNEQMSPMMARIFDLMQLGIGGYIGGRTIEKIVSNIGLSSVLKKFIEKKLG